MLAAVLAVLAAVAASAAPAPAAAAMRFAVTYAGRGSYATVYHATPPNPGGRSDTNDAHDRSTARWSIRYVGALTLPACLACRPPAGLDGARGATMVTARIDHAHGDGLFPALDMAVSCRISGRPPAGARLAASLAVRVAAGGRAIAVTAGDPVAEATTALPLECPGQGDSIDGLDNSYAGPGFSFAPGWGPERWFTSRTVFIRLAALRKARRYAVALSGARSGVPPRGCAVRRPAVERCTTAGAWHGVLVFTALP